MSSRDVPSALGVGQASLGIVTWSNCRLTSTDVERLSTGDHVGVVNAEVLAFEEECRLIAFFGGLAVPARERRAKLRAVRAEDPRIVLIVR